MKTKDLRMSLKVSIGNYEMMEIGQTVDVPDTGGDNDVQASQCFQDLVNSIMKKASVMVHILNRQEDCLMYKQVLNGFAPTETQPEVWTDAPENNIGSLEDILGTTEKSVEAMLNLGPQAKSIYDIAKSTQIPEL